MDSAGALRNSARRGVFFFGCGILGRALALCAVHGFFCLLFLQCELAFFFFLFLNEGEGFFKTFQIFLHIFGKHRDLVAVEGFAVFIFALDNL